MTELAVLAEPPHPGVLSGLVATSPLSEADAETLYIAMLRDVCSAAADSGGDLLVNYQAADSISGIRHSESALKDVLEDVIEDVRYEVQVGETFAGRVGNTVTHLLEREGVASAAAMTPNAALLTRQVIDEAAMKLRRSETVLGATADGRVYYAAFTEPVDFEAAYKPPAVSTLSDRAIDAGLDVDFLRALPLIESGPDLAAAMVALNTRKKAGRRVPAYLADCIEELPLSVDVDQTGMPMLVG
jgi:hypothetical protein